MNLRFIRRGTLISSSVILVDFLLSTAGAFLQEANEEIRCSGFIMVKVVQISAAICDY